MTRTALIAGAGPAGLTAALELLQRTDVRPIVIEADTQVGGISKTINYRGNRMDIGGHRFFSKSDWVMDWWQSILPVEAGTDPQSLTYHGRSHAFVPATSGIDRDKVMMVRPRLSRIYYRRKFFDYPLSLSRQTFANLGPIYTAQIGASYLWARLAPRKPQLTLEDFLYNRFGDKLYRTFFKDYTEKVWGVPCEQISAEWGAQRIKGLSISRAVIHALRRPFQSAGQQKNVETSLIERFLYPKYGPGQMWEEVAARVQQSGGKLFLRTRVVGIQRRGARIESVTVKDMGDGSLRTIPCEFLVSTMPIRELTTQLQPEDGEIGRIAGALPYRDFMTAGLLVRRMRPTRTAGALTANGMPADNWIYIQEPDVKLGRLQIFNNWSPGLVADPETIWLGLEYFCDEGDGLWSMQDPAFLDLAARELEKIGLIDRADVLDGTVVRVPKAYPAYFGEYAQIGRVRQWLDGIDNLFPVGRNGMHCYNNQDHSMLAAKAAVDCIAAGSGDKRVLWDINAEQEYHEARKEAA